MSTSSRCRSRVSALRNSCAAVLTVAGLWVTGLSPAHAAPVVQRVADLSTVQINYRERGKGRPVLFVHALLLDSRLWTDQLNALCETRRCLAPDFSGHGSSSHLTATKVDSKRYAAELLEFLDVVGVREPVDIVGLSGGGNIAMLACAQRPERCRSMTLISSVIGGTLDPAGVRYRAENARTVVIEGKDTLFRRFNEYIVAPSASLTARARYRSMLEQTPYETFVAFLTAAEQQPAASEVLPKLQMPVMIPVGTGDTVLTPEMAKKIGAGFPDARVVELASAGRLLPLESPAELNRALGTFWNELDSGGTRR
ncbi:MAG: alpha/beta fold hydrolase [Nevskiaceae bacterium]